MTQPETTTAPGFNVKPMTLAYLTTEYPAVSHTFIRREILELESRGHTIHRIAIRRTKGSLADPADVQEAGLTHHVLEQHRVQFVVRTLKAAAASPSRFMGALRLAWSMSRASDRGLLRHLAYLVEAAAILPDLRRKGVSHVHVHFGTNPAAVARLMHRMGGPGYSFTVHGPDEFDAPRALCLAGKISDARLVVAISHYGAAQLKRWAAHADWPKVQVVHCGVGDDFLSPAPPIDPTSYTLVCVGRLTAQKGQLTLLEAFAGVSRAEPRARLVMAGDGEMRDELRRRASDLGLGERVLFTGAISGAQVREHLKAARGFVLPSFAEGLPVVIMEALALGRPVISTYVAGIPELVVPGVSGWLTPAGNVKELTDAMLQMLAAPKSELERLGAGGRELVLRHHQVSKEVARLEQLLRAAIGPGGPQA